MRNPFIDIEKVRQYEMKHDKTTVAYICTDGKQIIKDCLYPCQRILEGNALKEFILKNVIIPKEHFKGMEYININALFLEKVEDLKTNDYFPPTRTVRITLDEYNKYHEADLRK